MATLRLEIVTPETKTFSDDVDSVVIPGAEGEFGVLPQHVALMTEIVPGELRIMKGGQETRLAVGAGFVEDFVVSVPRGTVGKLIGCT